MQRFSLAENVHIHPTPGGGYYAVSSSDSDPSRRLLRRLLLDVGIFLDEAYNDLSSMIKRQLRILVSSQIQVVHHALMLGPKLAPHYDVLRQALLAMADDPKGQGVLHNLGVTRWEGVDQEEMEFMIDLMDTLTV